MCTPTEYAVAQGAWQETDYKSGIKVCRWWLCDSGLYDNYAAFVTWEGTTHSVGDRVVNTRAVRPAIIVSPSFIESGSSSTSLDIFESGDYSYIKKTDSTVEIYAYTGSTSILTIPAAIDDMRVSSIGESAFKQNNGMTRVVIPEGVTSIGDYAFYECKNLIEVTIPSSVTYIGKYAFGNCTSLTTVNITANITVVEEYCFYYCTNLTTITIPYSVTSIGSGAFGYCSSLTYLELPSGIEYIGSDAFAGIFSLSLSVERGSYADSYFSSTSFTLIYSGAGAYDYDLLYDGTVSITSLTVVEAYLVIPSEIDGRKVTRIAEGAFRDRTELISVTIPSSVLYIEPSAFYGCTNLKEINIQANITRIEKYTFYNCIAVERIELPSSVTYIDEYAFCGCANLKTVVLSQNITAIGQYAFCNCVSLTEISLPQNVTQISEGAFFGCKQLRSISFGTSVTFIGASAFGRCEALTEFTVPESVTEIGAQAFFSCKNLTVITICSSYTTIGINAFQGCPNLIVYVLSGSAAYDYCVKYGINYQITDAATVESTPTPATVAQPTPTPTPTPVPASKYANENTSKDVVNAKWLTDKASRINHGLTEFEVLPSVNGGDVISMTGWSFATYNDNKRGWDGQNNTTYIAITDGKGKTRYYEATVAAGATGIPHNTTGGKNMDLADFTCVIDLSNYADGTYSISSFHYFTIKKADGNTMKCHHGYTFGEAYEFVVSGGKVTSVGGRSATSESVETSPRYELYSTVTFGHYEQDNNSKNGKEPIEWIVLDVEADGTCLLLSKYALDYKAYNDSNKNVTWETCSLRKWMNGEFYNGAFDASEKAKIQLTHNVTPSTPKYNIYGGRDTDDYVFTLTLQEIADSFGVVQYYWEDWKGDPSLKVQPTRYLSSKGVKTYDGYCCWWLRTPGPDQTYVVSISGETGEFMWGKVAWKTDRGVRVAIRVRL